MVEVTVPSSNPNGSLTTGAELEALTFLQMPEVFFRKALAAVYGAHETAWRVCYNNHADSEADDLVPIERRARLEGNLRAVAELVPGVTASTVYGRRGGCNHVEVRSGPIILTSSAVPRPCDPVRWANFRDTLARNSQGVLFGGDEPAKDAPLYVLLLHSHYLCADRDEQRKNGYLPGSVYLAWPAPDRTYVHTLNLFDKFPDVVEANTPRDWSAAARVSYIYRSRRVAYGL